MALRDKCAATGGRPGQLRLIHFRKLHTARPSSRSPEVDGSLLPWHLEENPLCRGPANDRHYPVAKYCRSCAIERRMNIQNKFKLATQLV
jgi:hypothetical protein